MKKIFSTVAMAMVAFVSVVSMTSCNNDDTSSFNAAPTVPTTTTQSTVLSNVKSSKEYAYQAMINAQVLDYFDITITRTAGSDVKTFSFDINDASAGNGTKVVFTENDKFQSSAVGVNYVAKVTPKANWKELVEANGLKRLPVTVTLSHTYKGTSGNFLADTVTFVVFTDESMPVIADCIAARLDYDGKSKINGHEL